MAYATNTFSGNGVTTNFALSFPYLSTDHVTVEVDGTQVAFTWLNSSTVTVSPAPADGTTVRVYRRSSQDSPMVDFTNGEVLTETSLDTAVRQALYVAQEAFDASEAVENTQQIQDWVDAATNAAAAAATSASGAAASASAASGSASSASTSASNASGSASAASASASAAAASAATAAGYATSALLKANNLSDLVNASTARTNLGLGSAATQASTAFATAAQGAKADTALQPDALVTTEAAKIVGDGTATAYDYVGGKILELASATGNTNHKRWLWSHIKDGSTDTLWLAAVNDAGTVVAPSLSVDHATGEVTLPYTTHATDIELQGLYSTGDTQADIAFGATDWSSWVQRMKFVSARSFFSASSPYSLGNLTGTPSSDLSAYNDYTATVTGNVTSWTLTAPDGPCTVRIKITIGGSGSYAITWPSSFKWPAAYASGDKLISTTAGKVDLLILYWDGTNYVANLQKDIA